MFDSDDGSTKAVIVFVVLNGTVRASSVMTGWGFEVASLEAIFNCIVRCGKCMTPCVVSLTTLLFLIKRNPYIGPVIVFITRKFSANILCRISNLDVVVANGFSNWPFAACFENWEKRRI